MFRPSVSPRVLRLGLAVVACALIGGAVGLWSVAGAQTPHAQPPQPPGVERAETTAPAAATPTQASATPTQAPASLPLTPEEATALATQVSPGQVVQVVQDSEPTGLAYDVTLQQNDGTVTKVEIDAATGQVLSIKQDDPPALN